MNNKTRKLALAIMVLSLFFLISTEPKQLIDKTFVPEISLYRVAFAQPGKVFNVKRFGAKGDGVTDDTSAIQAAINAATKGSAIYFPVGTYVASNFLVNNRSGLSFIGDGRTSVIKQRTGAARIASFNDSSDIVITRIAFDANGIISYGGVVFYGAKRVRIENTWFTDSSPRSLKPTDRYAYVFGKGPTPSQDIMILNNTILDLQLEVNHSKDVVIEGNTVGRAVGAAGIGIFTVSDNAIADNYLIKGNTVIDPPGVGFNVALDPPSNRQCIFRRITIVNNKIIRTKTGGYGVRIGTSDSSKSTTGNVFEDITVKGNLIQIEATAQASSQMIFANTSAVAGILFNRLNITGNAVENRGPKSNGYAIDLRRIQHSLVADNSIKGVANGISFSGDLLSNEVRNNHVEATDVAYFVEGSLGGNKATNNRIVGNPRTGWKVSGLKTSDPVEPKRF